MRRESQLSLDLNLLMGGRSVFQFTKLFKHGKELLGLALRKRRLVQSIALMRLPVPPLFDCYRRDLRRALASHRYGHLVRASPDGAAHRGRRRHGGAAVSP